MANIEAQKNLIDKEKDGIKQELSNLKNEVSDNPNEGYDLELRLPTDPVKFLKLLYKEFGKDKHLEYNGAIKINGETCRFNELQIQKVGESTELYVKYRTGAKRVDYCIRHDEETDLFQFKDCNPHLKKHNFENISNEDLMKYFLDINERIDAIQNALKNDKFDDNEERKEEEKKAGTAGKKVGKSIGKFIQGLGEGMYKNE